MGKIEKLNVVNLTPHSITIFGVDGEELTFPPSGTEARVEVKELPAGLIPLGGDLDSGLVRTVRQSYGEVTGLPREESGTIYLVSRLVLDALPPTRTDVFAPNTNDARRDENGRIIGVNSLVGVKQ